MPSATAEVAPEPADRRIDLVLLLVAVVWGSSYLAAKTATAELPVPVVLFARYGISAVACVGLVAARRTTSRTARRATSRTARRTTSRTARRTTRRRTRDELRLGALLGVTQAAVLVLETYGVAHTSAANAGLIISLTIILTPLLDRGRLPAAFYAAAGLCLVAVALLTSGSGFHAPRPGDLLILGAALVRAGHVALVGRLTARRAVRPLRLTTVQMLVGTVLCVPLAAPRLDTLAATGPATWAQLAYLALFCGVFAFLAQTWAVQRTSASRASLLLGTEPVWAVAVGVLAGGERLTVLATLGAALMITGTYWGQSVERAHRARALTHLKENRPCPTPASPPAPPPTPPQAPPQAPTSTSTTV